MPTPGIVLDGVYKKFRRGELHDSLRDLIPAMAARLRPKKPETVRPQARLSGDEFWALENISFEVKPGDALGIIGGNGAGKSTTLKIINGILRPNRGVCRVAGRMGALIEIAAGFHPDLTGRENVFLQGLIMGMSKDIIRERFDQIVEFAGMGTFIDTPVKRYSSGMNARLGFAIAAHLEPDVLIIDEVLSVGDFRFQQRAYDRVRELINSGIPVVVVSHQLDRVATLCTRALVLQHGRVIYDGPPQDAVASYLSDSGTMPTTTIDGREPELVLESFTVANTITSLSPGAGISLRIVGRANGSPGAASPYSIGVRVSSTQDGHTVATISTARSGLTIPSAGPFDVRVDLDMNVPPGVYRCDAFAWDVAADREVGRNANLFLNVLEVAGVVGGTAYLRPRVAVRSVVDAGEHDHQLVALSNTNGASPALGA